MKPYKLHLVNRPILDCRYCTATGRLQLVATLVHLSTEPPATLFTDCDDTFPQLAYQHCKSTKDFHFFLNI